MRLKVSSAKWRPLCLGLSVFKGKLVYSDGHMDINNYVLYLKDTRMRQYNLTYENS